MSDVENVEHREELVPAPKPSMQKLLKIIRLSLTHIWSEEGVHIGWADKNDYQNLCQLLLGCAPTDASAYRHLAQEKARYDAGIAAAKKPRKKRAAAQFPGEEEEEEDGDEGDEWAGDDDDGGGGGGGRASRKRRKVSKTFAEEEEEGDEAEEGGESEGDIEGDFDGESEGDEDEGEEGSGDEDGGGGGGGEGLQEELQLDALLDAAELDAVPTTGITRPVLQVGQRVKIRESSVGWANENIPGSCVEHTTGAGVRRMHGIIRGESRRSWRVQFFSTHVPARLFDVKTDRLYGLFPDEWALATEQRFAAIRD